MEIVKDTIVVPAHVDAFKRIFLGENSWYAIRVGGDKLREIKYIAGYQTAPVSAVTHYAEVESIEPYGNEGKCKLKFKSPAVPIGPIIFGNAKSGAMQVSRYTTFEKLNNAKCIDDLF